MSQARRHKSVRAKKMQVCGAEKGGVPSQRLPQNCLNFMRRNTLRY